MPRSAHRRSRRKRVLFVVLLLVTLLLGGALFALWWVDRRPEPLDARFNGAYQLGDQVLIVTPRTVDTLRYRIVETGETLALHPAEEAGDGLTWVAHPVSEIGEEVDETAARPVVVTVTFDPPDAATADGVPGPAGLTFERAGEGPVRAARIAVREEMGSFENDGLDLRSKLLLPPAGAGEPPYPAVVLVHGSGDDSAVDRYAEAYLFPPFGIATLVYDKRGTGESTGSYTQNFPLLAGDVLAAVEALRERPDIDPERIHLAGYSQGGWIAPLAAARLPEEIGGPPIRSLLIGYGTVVPIVEEDRWGWVYALEQKGYSEAEMADAQELHDLSVAIIDRREDRWDELEAALDAAQGEQWFEDLAGSDSILGIMAAGEMPFWAMKPYLHWRLWQGRNEPPVSRLDDPMPVMRQLDVPSLWLMGGEDSSLPTDWTIDRLEELRAAGAPVAWKVWPEAEHGIWRVEIRPDGERRFPGLIEPDYMSTEVDWLRVASGLAPVWPERPAPWRWRATPGDRPDPTDPINPVEPIEPASGSAADPASDLVGATDTP